MKILATIKRHHTNKDNTTIQEWYDMDDIKDMIEIAYYTENHGCFTYVTVTNLELRLSHTGG